MPPTACRPYRHKCVPAADAGRYKLTEKGMVLTRRAEASLHDWALFEGKLLARSWLGLADPVRSGKTASQLSGSDDGRFAEMERDMNVGGAV